jgi:peptidoglycan hydrolase CwlO-like protein
MLGAAAIAATIALLPLSSASPAAAAGSNEPSLTELQRKREEVRRQAASQASQVNALEASEAEVTTALSALTANVNAQQDQLEEAERAVAQAQADQAAAEAAQAEKQAELDALTAKMKDSAVTAYMTMGSSDNISVGTDDINDAVNKRTMMSLQANESVTLIEEFRAVQEELEIQREAATDASERAAASQEQVASRLSELESAYAEQQAFAAQVEARLDAALSEAESLKGLDDQLSSSISAKQAEIAKAVAAQRAAEQARATAARAGSSSGSSGGGGGGGGGGGAPATITGSGEIVTVGGIRIHQSMASNLQALLNAASAAGINFGGGGYRDPSGQIAVRRNNCGSSNYAIYEMPASSCSPPTARPGTSMHERGLAVDFTQGGSTLTRGSSGYAWLKANGASFGFYNLPSEPWHWSSNGN